MRLTLPTRLLRLIMIILPSIVLLAGCGEGSGKEVVAGTQSPAITGVLLDAPLAGVEWTNSGGDLSGITNELGEFQYRQYETVTFTIGGIVLGTAAGAPFVTAVQLTESTNATDQAAVNQLVFLQSIDVDGDPSNGIFISEATRNRAANVSLDFKASDFAARVATVVAAVGEPGSSVVSETDALQHFFETFLSFGGAAVLGFEFPGFAPSEFKLVFSDEFNTGTSPNESKWTIETGYGPNNDGWGNNEWQLYTTSADNVRVEGGNLVLSAQCPTPPCGVRDGSVTSGKINTLDKFNFRYGKVVARIKPPVGAGAWPAFWALGANHPQIGWPRSGEIDFMEVFNTGSNDRTTHFTMHWCDQTIQAPAVCSFPQGRIFVSDSLTLPESLGDDFHIFEAEWDAERIIGKIDGMPYFELAIDPATMEEFQRDFYMILNVAMGGTLGSGNQPPTGNEVWPQTMLVDYVRVFQAEGGPAGSTVIDFEDAPESYVFPDGGFGGGASAVIPNPVSGGINTSAQVARMQKFSAEPFGGSRLNLPEPVEVTAGSVYTMKVWSPRAVEVLLKLENNLGEVTVTHSGSGWEELTFDFSGFSGTVEAYTFIFDNGTVGDAGGDPDRWTFYFDDITLIPPDDGGTPPPVVDTTPPRLTVARIRSNNANTQAARVGDVVTVTLAADEPIESPTVTIGGVAATTVTGAGDTWQARRTLTAADTTGPLRFSIAFRDVAGNAGTTVTTATDARSVVFDKTAPTVTILGAPATFSTLAPIPVTFQFSEVVSNFSVGGIQVTNGVASSLMAVDGDTYTANITPTGAAALAINVAADAARDAAGNSNAFTGTVIVVRDTSPPILSSVNVASNNANPAFAVRGNTVTVSLMANEPIPAPVVRIGGVPATTVTGSGTTWQARRMLTSTDAEGAISFSIAYMDLLGNPGAPISTSTDASGVVLDTTAPTLMITGAPASFVTLDPIRVTFQFSETVTGFDQASDIVVTNGTASTPVAVDGDTYTADITPAGTGNLTIGVAAGAAVDRAGNASQMATTVTILGDTMAPSLTTISIASNNANPALAKVGNVVTVTFLADEPIATPTVTIGAVAATSVTNVGGDQLNWQASRTITAGETGGTLALSIAYSDTSGNPGTVRTTTTNGSAVVLDVVAPTVMILGAPATVTSLAPFTVTFRFSEQVTGFDAVSDIATSNATASAPVLMDAATFTYSASITPTGGALSIGVNMGAAQDLAGNPNTMATTVSVVVDTTPPELMTVSIASSNANPLLAKLGDVVTVTMLASEPITAPVVTIAGAPATSVTNMSGDQLNWQASRTLSAGTDGPVGFNITYSDVTGTAGMPVTMTSDGSSVFLDVTPPEATIMGAPANFTSTAAIPLTVQFTSAVSGFTDSMMDFVISGGSAGAIVADPLDGSRYTTSITPSGSGDLTVAVAAGAAQDAAGNVNPVSASVTITNNLPAGAPRLTTVRIVSNNPNNTGFARNGELVTLTMTADEPIAIPTIAIGGIAATSVVNMSGDQLNWTASRTVLATDAGVVQGAPIAFTIDIVDTGGTPGPGLFSVVTDGPPVIFDNLGPTLTIVGVPPTFDTLAALPVTFQFNENVSGFDAVDVGVTGGSLSGFAGGGMTYTATVTPTPPVMGAPLTVSVAAGVASDAAGNFNTATSVVATPNDEMGPTLLMVSIASSPGNPAFARAGDVVTLSFTASEPIMTPTVTIDGGAAAVTNTSGDQITWQATLTLAAGMDRTIGFAINYVDLFGNPAVMPGTAVTDMTSVTFDMTAPTVTITTPAAAVSSLAAIPVTFVFSEQVTGFDAILDIMATNGTASAPVLMDAATFTYTANITPAGDGEVSIGVPIAAAQDLAGNDNTMATTVTVVVDTTPPELNTVTIASSNTTNTAYATNGDTVTLDFVANEAIAAPTVTIGGIAATSVTNTSDDQVTWRASREVSASDMGSIVENDPIAFSISFQDVLGNAGVSVNATTAPATSVTFDSLAPTLTIGGIDPTLSSLETITVTFTFNEDVTGFDETDIDITNGVYVASSFIATNAREYTADITPNGAGDLTFTVAVMSGKAVDVAGNGNTAASVTATIEPFWQLVWSDTFDVAGIDSRWNVRTNTDCPAPCSGNQDYLASRVSVTGDGVLRIQAIDDTGGDFPYSSGLIDTRGNESLRYGRIEIDAILPSTAGASPLLWLLPEPVAPAAPDDGVYGPWPLSGEIDIVNAFDLSGNVKHSLVYGLPEGEETTTTGTSAFVAGGVSHKYAIEWEAGEIRWFVDDTHVATQIDDNWYAYYPDADGVFTLGTDPEPFDQEFYLAISLAVGTPTGAFDETLQIEEVRVYECFAGNPVDGTGCSTGTGAPTVSVIRTEPYTETLDVYVDGSPGVLDFEPDSGDPIPKVLVDDTIGSGVTSDTAAPDDDRGNVWHVFVPATGGSVVMQPPDTFTAQTGYFDLTGGGTAGEVLFEMRVNASTTAGTISVGLDSDMGGSRKELVYTADGVWRPYSVKIADLVAGAFFRGGSINIANLLNAFVLEASGGTADLDLDNVFLKVACRDVGGCEATPKTAPETVPPTVVYSQNFEGTPDVPIPDGDINPDTMNPSLIGDNWVFFVNVYAAGNVIPRFGYGQPAPNGPQISAIVTDQGGPSQGGQQLSVYSDYECCPGDFFNPPTGHQNGTDTVETNVFAELLITAADIGAVFTLSFDAKAGNIGGVSTANGFIKVLQEVEAGAPGPGGNDFFVVAEENVDTTSLSDEWSRLSVEITITSDMIGGADVVDVTLQLGFQTNGVNFSNTNNFYDNVELTRAVP